MYILLHRNCIWKDIPSCNHCWRLQNTPKELFRRPTMTRWMKHYIFIPPPLSSCHITSTWARPSHMTHQYSELSLMSRWPPSHIQMENAILTFSESGLTNNICKYMHRLIWNVLLSSNYIPLIHYPWKTPSLCKAKSTSDHLMNRNYSVCHNNALKMYFVQICQKLAPSLALCYTDFTPEQAWNQGYETSSKWINNWL